MPEQAGGQSMTWLYFAMMTVASWGTYGVLLHAGQGAMGDVGLGRYKAFLWVGMAYFITAVLAPAAVLLLKGADWNMPGKGIALSLAAGTVGAIGAFGVLLAFGAKGTPPVVMSIVFAGAPIVNAIVAMILHPPAGGFSAIRFPFVLGIVLAAAGGCLVSLYRPKPGPPPGSHKDPPAQTASAEPTAAESTQSQN